jgi:hypothetical protein
MLDWKNPGRGGQRMMEVMNLIFRYHPKLLEFLFDSEGPQLCEEAEDLMREAGVFSSGEKILVRIALNLWNGYGSVSLWDVIERLDQRNYQQVILGLQHLRRFDPHSEEMRFRQLKLDIDGLVAN